MTTTELTIGLGGSERISSRVLKPPGGGSSNIFGPPDDAPVPSRPRHSASSASIGDAPAAESAPPAEEPADPAAQEDDADTDETEAGADDSENCEDGGVDPASAGDGAEPAATPPAEKPEPAPAPARGRVPPGGFSTPLW
ncbi:skin secretory protein xP2-like [Pollicipes pollicipes]|uniref:skin secretory protein xP2-like n=1 Tax=Pollicipes pollicipes TaxID=41117 RepID=UPI00188593E0|nr:skin secretory protein xP2-like [Pollicipes pollicipes]